MYKTLAYSFSIGLVFSVLLAGCGQAPASAATAQTLQSTEVAPQPQVTKQSQPAEAAPATSVPTDLPTSAATIPPTEEIIPTAAPSAVPIPQSEDIRDKILGKWRYVMTRSNGNTTTDSSLTTFNFSDASTLELTATNGEIIKTKYNLTENNTVLQVTTERGDTLNYKLFIEEDKLTLVKADDPNTEFIYNRITQ